MGLAIFLPSTKDCETTAKDAIVSILANDWPLNISKIFNILQHQYGLNVSYQAVHKTLNYLLEHNVVKKQGKEFLLNADWIKQLKGFSELLESNYSKHLLIPVYSQEKQLNNLTFDTLYEVDQFLFKIMELHQAPKKEVLVCHWSHLWWPLFYSKQEYEQLKKVVEKNKAFVLAGGKTIVDKWCAQFYRELGAKVKLGVQASSTADLFVYKDVVIQVFYPPKVLNRIREVYEKTRTISDIDLADFFRKVFEKKAKIQLTFNRNRFLAEQLKKQTMDLFK